MTKDLALITSIKNPTVLNSEAFIKQSVRIWTNNCKNRNLKSIKIPENGEIHFPVFFIKQVFYDDTFYSASSSHRS